MSDEAYRNLEEYEQRLLADAPCNDARVRKSYQRMFDPPPIDNWRLHAHFPDGYYRSTLLILDGVIRQEFDRDAEGAVALYLCRHYLELKLKYTLLHSRWLLSETENNPETAEAIVKTHNLQNLLGILISELSSRFPAMLHSSVDIDFLKDFIADFHLLDPSGDRFRYPAKEMPTSDKAVTITAGAFGSHGEEPCLGVDFAKVRDNFVHAGNVLSVIDSELQERYGENFDWDGVFGAS